MTCKDKTPDAVKHRGIFLLKSSAFLQQFDGYSVK